MAKQKELLRQDLFACPNGYGMMISLSEAVIITNGKGTYNVKRGPRPRESAPLTEKKFLAIPALVRGAFDYVNDRI